MKSRRSVSYSSNDIELLMELCELHGHRNVDWFFIQSEFNRRASRKRSLGSLKSKYYSQTRAEADRRRKEVNPYLRPLEKLIYRKTEQLTANSKKVGT